MLITGGLFRRLCHARDLLLEVRDETPSIRETAETVHVVSLQIKPQTGEKMKPRDIEREYARLKSSGVVFTRQATRSGPISLAVLSDTCSDLIQIYQLMK